MSPARDRGLDEVVHERVDPLRAGRARGRRAPSRGRSSARRMPKRIASSMSWLMYATRSTMRTILPSSVSGSSWPVCLRMPSRTSHVRFSDSAMRSDCSLWRKPRPNRSRRHSSSASSPAWPNGGWPMSWPRPIASVRSSFSCSAARDAAGDRGRLERVRHARPVVVARRVDEDLRLALQAAKRLRVEDAVAVALERRPDAARLLVAHPPAGLVRAHRERREPALLVLAHPLLRRRRQPVRRAPAWSQA